MGTACQVRRSWRTLKRWKHQQDELKHPIYDSKHGEICKDGSNLWLYCSQRPRLSEFIQQLWQVLSSLYRPYVKNERT